MKLFRVHIKGSGGKYDTSYVVADGFDSVYQKVREFLDREDICFSNQRESKSIELVADSDQYGDIDTLLFL